MKYSQRGGGGSQLVQVEGAWIVQREGNGSAFRCNDSSPLPPRVGWTYNTKLHKKAYKLDTRLTLTLSSEVASLTNYPTLHPTPRQPPCAPPSRSPPPDPPSRWSLSTLGSSPGQTTIALEGAYSASLLSSATHSSTDIQTPLHLSSPTGRCL